MQTLSPLLLRLYRVARSVPAPEFRHQAVAAIKEFLPFDSGLWGAFAVTREGARVHWVFLDQQPEQMMRDWDAIKEHDWLHHTLQKKFGYTLNVNVTRQAKRFHPDALAHTQRYQMHQILATISLDPVLNLCNAISFYRGKSGRPFTEAERRLKQDLMPHLIEASNINAIQYVDRHPGARRSRGAQALIDLGGTVHNAEPDFADVLRVEFPDWKGPTIPEPVANAIVGFSGRSFRGRAIVAETLNAMNDGIHLISVRRIAVLDALSARELAVAREFASGRTHKEIARALGVSPATVRNQLQSAYAKLGVTSKIALARLLDHGQ